MVNGAAMGDKDRRITQLLEEIRRMKSEDQLKSEQIRLLLTKNKRLQEQLDKSKARIAELTAAGGGGGGAGGGLNTISEEGGGSTAGKDEKKPPSSSANLANTRQRAQGISGESKKVEDIYMNLQDFDKTDEEKSSIEKALLGNVFMKNLKEYHISEIVRCMYPVNYNEGDMIITEGTSGDVLYALQEGRVEVQKEGKKLAQFGGPTVFGELAILYKCPRTASILVISSKAKVWAISRDTYQTIMMKDGIQRQMDALKVINNVQLLKKLPESMKMKLSSSLMEETYSKGEYIIRQGSIGDTFFILNEGEVLITVVKEPGQPAVPIRTLQKGAYFGEVALLREEPRTANVIAVADQVVCYVVEREKFMKLIGGLEFEKYNDNDVDLNADKDKDSDPEQDEERQKFDSFKLTDFKRIATLGVGGFGRVDLVKHRMGGQTYALKSLKKQHVVDTKQQEHVVAEANIMRTCRSPFVVRLYKTYKDTRYVYMLLEVCLGGELWTKLRDMQQFDEHTAKFVVGCVVEGLNYLHSKGIVYRDLKPENLLLDERGYVKIVDFGFSKKIGFRQKTWTFCGTPEYVSPEIILNKGHDLSADFWSLGILIFEILTGNPPFCGSDGMKTYNLILQGINMISFPVSMSKAAVNIIRKLCRENPAERLGYQKNGFRDIKKHLWFQGLNWDSLRLQTTQPPIIPNIKSKDDHSNFDPYPDDDDYPPEEFSGWDADF